MIRLLFAMLGVCVGVASMCAEEPPKPQESMSAPLLRLARSNSDEPAVLLDPCVVRHDGNWHLFAGGPCDTLY